MKFNRAALRALYQQAPDRADWLAFGRRSDPVSRRGFISGLGRMSAAVGSPIVFARFLPAGVVPVVLAEEPTEANVSGKHPDLVVLNDRPLNVETPAHLLDDDVTPADRLFVRNNGLPPSSVDTQTWRLLIDGEAVEKPIEFSLDQLKQQFEHYSYQLTLECGGNGRAEFNPPARGNQWTTGAVGCPRWTGARLRDVLEQAGIKTNAVYIGYYGADTHISGDPNKVPISRGVPIEKAREDEALIAWAMNDQPIPPAHGYPLRLVLGGWPASVSGKWLNRISVRDRVHDGAKMGGYSYRVPCEPVAPGADVAEEQMCIIEAMPVKSLVTLPRSGITHSLKEALPVRGHAWAGDRSVRRVEVSIDFGQSWQPTELAAPANRNAWQRWTSSVQFPQAGYYEIWARATDNAGTSQPMVLPGWNPRGYLNNACHRVAVRVV
jgi:DMSO/TMAO reductase YedYZ molybdopterin-dependent catalytic subunit